jgi:hypothetical protein
MADKTGGREGSLTWRTMDSTPYITMHTTWTAVKTVLVLGQNCATSANAHVASPTAVAQRQRRLVNSATVYA